MAAAAAAEQRREKLAGGEKKKKSKHEPKHSKRRRKKKKKNKPRETHAVAHAIRVTLMGLSHGPIWAAPYKPMDFFSFLFFPFWIEAI